MIRLKSVHASAPTVDALFYEQPLWLIDVVKLFDTPQLSGMLRFE